MSLRPPRSSARLAGRRRTVLSSVKVGAATGGYPVPASCLIVSGAYNLRARRGTRWRISRIPPALPASTPRAGSKPTSPTCSTPARSRPSSTARSTASSPTQQFPPRLGDDISFNGDGMITRFHFHDGQCDFRQRWAQTDKWKLEHAAGKALFGAYRNPLTDDESGQGPDPRHRQHQRLPVRRQAVGAQGGQPGAGHGPGDDGNRRLREVRRQDDRADLHRAPEDRPCRPAT